MQLTKSALGGVYYAHVRDRVVDIQRKAETYPWSHTKPPGERSETHVLESSLVPVGRLWVQMW